MSQSAQQDVPGVQSETIPKPDSGKTRRSWSASAGWRPPLKGTDRGWLPAAAAEGDGASNELASRCGLPRREPGAVLPVPGPSSLHGRSSGFPAAT
jgi:hypothetical protein